MTPETLFPATVTVTLDDLKVLVELADLIDDMTQIERATVRRARKLTGEKKR